MSGRRTVLLDRDGTIVVEQHYLADPAKVILLDGAAAGLRRLSRLGLRLVLVSNQAGIGRGLFTQADLAQVQQRLAELLRAEGVELDGAYFCPHAPWEGCACRKPEPGMAEQAAREMDFDLREAFLIGDNAGDIGMGQRVGATTLLVKTGYGAQVAAEGKIQPDHSVENLDEAAAVIERLVMSERLESLRAEEGLRVEEGKTS